MTSKPLPIHTGGLMRCCTGTYLAKAPPAEDTPEGLVLPCDHCSSSMIAREESWRWNRAER